MTGDVQTCQIAQASNCCCWLQRCKADQHHPLVEEVRIAAKMLYLRTVPAAVKTHVWVSLQSLVISSTHQHVLALAFIIRHYLTAALAIIRMIYTARQRFATQRFVTLPLTVPG